jgi:hypothetical protein
VIIILWIISDSQTTINAKTLKCTFTTGSWQFAITMYYCDVHNNRIFSANSSINITDIEGQHIRGRNNDNLAGISFNMIPNVSRFPRHLDQFFANLIGIQVYNSSMSEIQQSDLKVFPKLKYLYLCCNKLTVIEANLFEFNPELQLIWLQKNKIYHIDPFVFTFLHRLEVLWLDGNNCSKSFGDVNNSGEVEKVVKRIEDEGCSNYRYTSNQIYEKIGEESKKLQAKIEGISVMLMRVLDENRAFRVRHEETLGNVNKVQIK